MSSPLPPPIQTWSDLFRFSGSDLWTICERALALAYLHDPFDFIARRDALAQKLFAPEKLDFDACASRFPSDDEDIANPRQESEFPTRAASFDDLDALTRELEDEMLCKTEILTIKQLMQERSYQSELELYNSLRRLELMDLSFDLLKETEIGRVVNGLRKDSSVRVAALAKRLVRSWKGLVQACCRSATAVAAAATIEPIDRTSGFITFDDECGLPSPPMDDVALLVASTTSADCMSQLWDLIEDDSCKVVDYGHCIKDSDSAKHGSLYKGKASSFVSATNSTTEKITTEVPIRSNSQDQISHLYPLKDRPHQDSQHKFAQQKSLIDKKMETAKRNLRVNYEREEHAKRQRTIQVLDLHDLPKGGLSKTKMPHLMHGKPGSQPRPRALICR